jgi:hypothetical protein
VQGQQRRECACRCGALPRAGAVQRRGPSMTVCDARRAACVCRCLPSCHGCQRRWDGTSRTTNC